MRKRKLCAALFMLCSTLVGGAVATERAARADVCFSSGRHYDSRPDSGGQDAGGDGATLGLGRSGRRRATYAGSALILAAGLGLAWIGSRRKGDDDDGSAA